MLRAKRISHELCEKGPPGFHELSPHTEIFGEKYISFNHKAISWYYRLQQQKTMKHVALVVITGTIILVP